MTSAEQSQSDKFKEAARALECDDDPERFKERLGKLVRHKLQGEGGVTDEEQYRGCRIVYGYQDRLADVHIPGAFSVQVVTSDLSDRSGLRAKARALIDVEVDGDGTEKS